MYEASRASTGTVSCQDRTVRISRAWWPSAPDPGRPWPPTRPTTEGPGTGASNWSRLPLSSFCRETRSLQVRPLPNGRGSDKKSRLSAHLHRHVVNRPGRLRRDGAHYLDAVQPGFFDALLNTAGIAHRDAVGRSAPPSGNLKSVPIGWNARVDDEAAEGQPYSQDPTCGGRVAPAGAAGQPWVAGAAEGGVVAAHDELAIGIGLGFAGFNAVVLAIGQQRIVELHGAIATPELAFGDDRPRVRMAENSGIFLDALIDPRHKTDFIVRF